MQQEYPEYITNCSPLIFGDNYLEDPEFNALPDEVKKVYIEEVDNGSRVSASDDLVFFTHPSIKKHNDSYQQRLDEFIRQLNERAKENSKFSEEYERSRIGIEEEFFQRLEENNRCCEEEEEFLNILNQSLHDLREEISSEHQQAIESEDVSVKISMKPDKSYNRNQKSTGTQYLNIPHIDESKLDALRDFYFTYGKWECVYQFAPVSGLSIGKQIKIRSKTKKEGIRAIDELLKIVRLDMIKGDAKTHCTYTQKDKHSLDGIRATVKDWEIVSNKNLPVTDRTDPPRK
jgi:hypothetical protein